jgi:hypothetical protein
MRINRFQRILLTIFGALVVYWIWLTLSHHTGGFYNYLYSWLFGFIPLLGGFVGIFGSRIWGGRKSALGRAVLFLSFGLFLWGAGEMVWSYYNFFVGQAAPYPSLADLGFGPSIFFWVLGVANLAQASGARFGWRKTSTKAVAVAALLVMLVISYYLLVVVARGGVITSGGGVLKVILDIAYPLGDLLALTFAVLIYTLSRRYLGGQYKAPILSILIGMAVMYCGDFTFSYTTTVNTYYNGDWGDLILMVGLTFLTFGALGFCVKPRPLAPKGSDGRV